MIELASTAWNMNTAHTLFRLKRIGFDIATDEDSIEKYTSEYVEYRKKLNLFYQKAVDNFQQPQPEASTLLKKLRLRVDPENKRWAEGAGQLIGHMDRKEVEMLYHPNAFSMCREKTYVYATNRCTFRGRNWGEVLMFPAYDVPNRIRCFLYIGRDANPDKDFVYRYSQLHHFSHRADTCAGAFMHPKVWETKSQIVYAIANPLMAYRLQYNHLRHSTIPLPLAGFFDLGERRPRHVWEWFQGKQLIFWSPEDITKAFRQAINHNGLVATIGCDLGSQERLDNYLTKRAPTELLGDLKKNAKPWRKALSHFILNREDHEIHEMISAIQAAKMSLENICVQLDKPAREVLNDLISKDQVERLVVIRQKQVVEKNDGWYIEEKAGRELLSNARLVVETVVRQHRLNKTTYLGKIYFEGEEIPFSCGKPTLDKYGFRWIEDFLLEKGKGILQYDPSWACHAVRVAFQFNTPKFKVGSDFVGYDKENQKLCFPGYTINSGGELVMGSPELITADLPGKTMAVPEVLSPQELCELKEPVAWSIMAAIAHNVLAPAFDEQTTGIALFGRGAMAVLDILKKEFDLRDHRLHGRHHLDTFWDKQSQHGWPVVTLCSTRGQGCSWLQDSATDDKPLNCFIPVNFFNFQALRMSGGWKLIKDNKATGLDQQSAKTANSILAFYLKDVMERQLEVEREDPLEAPTPCELLRDMQQFVERYNGDTAAVIAAQDLLEDDTAENRAEALADVLGEFVRDGLFTAVPEGFQQAPSDCLLFTNVGPREALLIPKMKFLDKFEKKLGRRIDVVKLTYSLADAGVLLEDREKAWLVCKSWWAEKQQKLMAKDRGMLRLYG